MRKKINRHALPGQNERTRSVVQTSRRAKRSLVLTAAAVGTSVVGLWTRSAAAQNIYTWTGSSSTTFSTAGNWSPSGPPTLATDIAEFSSSSTATNNDPTLSGSTAFGGIWATGNGTGTTPYDFEFATKHLTLDGTTINGNSGFGVEVDSGNSVIFDGGSNTSSNQYLTTGAAQAWLINGNVTFQNFAGSSLDLTIPYALTIEGSGTTQIENKWNGSGSLTIDGTGTVSFVGSGTTDTYTGQLMIESGTLKINAANNQSGNGQLGASSNTNSIIMGGAGTTGTLEYAGTSNNGSNRSINLATGGTGAIQVDTSGVTLTLNGAITGSGALSMNGAGYLFISGNTNNYSGGTAVNSGTLQIGSINALGTGSVAVNSPGLLDLDGNSPTIGNLSGSGTVDNTSTVGISTLNIGTSTSSNFSGVVQNSHTQMVALNVSGSGTQTLSGVNTFTGGTTVSSGELVIAPTSTPNAVALPDGAVSVGAAGTLQLADNASASTPFVSSSTDISNQLMTISSLSIASGGVLDIRNNHFYVADSGGPDDATYQSILGYVANGANSISNGVITSSEGLPGYGVGVVDGNDGVLGTPVSAGQIEVAYTLEGDANLDGKVDITDFNIFAPNFGLPTTLGWEAGDFNYSGAVDIGDFNLFAGNFGLSDNGTAVSMPAADYAALDAFAAANGLSLTSVPEPTSFGLIGVSIMGLLARRRRTRP